MGLIFLGIGAGRYYMNYEMVVRYPDMSEDANDFPFSEYSIDARPFIVNQVFIKLSKQLIYNPNIVPLKGDAIRHYIMMWLDDEKESFPELYKKYRQYDGRGKGYPPEKIQKIQYLFTTFRRQTNLPDEETFLVIFDEGKNCIMFTREPEPKEEGEGYYYSLSSIEKTEDFMSSYSKIVDLADKTKAEVEARSPEQKQENQ